MFQAVIDNIPQMIFWKDKDLKYIDCNQSYASFLGLNTSSEIVGLTEYDLLWTLDEANCLSELDKKTLAQGEARTQLEMRTTIHDQLYCLRLTRIPLHDKAEDVIGLLGVLENITDQIDTEKALRESQEMLQLVMDNIPHAIFWKNREYVILGGNRNFFIDAGDGTPESVIGKTDYELTYRIEEADFFREVDRRVMDNDQPEYHIIEPQLQADGKQAWLETNKIPLHDGDGNVVGILGTYEDITERKDAEESRRRELEQRVEERTRELMASNNQLKREIARRERIEEALRLSEQRYALATNAGKVCIWDWHIDSGDIFFAPGLQDLLGLDEQDTPATFDDWLQLIHPDDRTPFVNTLEKHLLGDTSHCENKLRMVHQNGDIRWILSRGTIIGDGSAPRIMGSITDITDLTTAQQAEHEQRMLAEALCDNAELLNSTLNIEEVLDRILKVIERTVPHEMANIMLVDKDCARIVRYQSKLNPDNAGFRPMRRYTLEENRHLDRMQLTRQPMTIDDIGCEDPYWLDLFNHQQPGSYVGAPICLEGEVIGFINLHSSSPGFYSAKHPERLQAFANQASSAIQNARSFERAQALAALEERQRLARDLHDAVSQTLWSANITAEVLPNLWEQSPEEGRQSLADLQNFTRGALAEMRSLLIELRPTGLVDTRLETLLGQLAESMSNRMGIPVILKTTDSGLLPPDVQIAFYRIAQEALNNISRHTTATCAEVIFDHQPDAARLYVADDGNGFDPANIPSRRLGLSIMRERAVSIGASLTINSQPGYGTQIQLDWYNEEPTS